MARGLSDGAVPDPLEVRGSTPVDIPPRDVEIGLVARSGEVASEMARVRLTWAGAGPREPRGKPRLFALVIGVSDYAQARLNLRFAGKDARDFADAIRRQAGQQYETVEVRLLADAQATSDAILEGLAWLKASTGANDVGLLFLAGHGMTDDRNRYYFLPHDADTRRLRQTTISREDIQDTLQSLPGKALVFLDTCHAGAGAVTAGAPPRGGVDASVLVNELSAAESGVVTFAAATGREVALEDPAWQNGAFTRALIEGFVDGKADLSRDGRISASELDEFVTDRVRGLTGGRQNPVMVRPPTVPNFQLAALAR
jgi:uncharacterized caspase-like protein